VILNPDGQVSLYEQQPDETPQWHSEIDYKTKAFNGKEWHTLRLAVDTSPGVTRITSLQLDGKTLDPEQKGIFRDTSTRYFGVYLHNAPDATESAAINLFSLAPIP
jgi:hypothetical protein